MVHSSGHLGGIFLMSELRILIYGDIDLNFMDGSGVWLISIASMLSLNSRIKVDILLKAKEKNSHLINEIKGKDNIRLFHPFKEFAEYTSGEQERLSVETSVRIMEKMNTDKAYDLIIVRGFDLVREIMKYAEFQKITVPYLTDFKHDHTSTEKERKDLKLVYNHFRYLFLQTKEAKLAFQNLIKVDGRKIQLLYPMIPEMKTAPSFQNKHSRLIYSGKFHENWHTEEIISVAQKINKKNSEIKIQIVGDKFQDRLRERDNQIRIKKDMNEVPTIEWLGAVSRSNCQKFISEADVGIAWRNKLLDNDESVELSTKLLEYGIMGKPTLVRRTKMHEDLLGKDYPLFVDTEEDVLIKSKLVLQDDNLYRLSAGKIYKASKNFTFQASYERLENFIWSFYKKKLNIVFAGHDLKFAHMIIEHFENNPNFEVRIDEFKSHNKHDVKYSNTCLEFADVIFCEWGLGNAVWYAKNKKAHQILIIRMHFQEKDLDFPKNILIENVDKIIVITPYMLEEFHRLFEIPRYKMVYLDNLVDTKKFNLTKMEKSNFNLGICGILPARKRLDLAVDLFEKLWEQDSRYRLFIKGKLPEEVPWLIARKKELLYYNNLFERINRASWCEAVVFDPHGNDVDKWLQKIGYLLSPSDYEGSHVAVSEALASGSVPIIRNWRGADTLYPDKYIVNNEEEAKVLIKNKNIAKQEKERKQFADYKFNSKRLCKEIESLINSEIQKIM